MRGWGATAPNLGNCRGRASRGRDEPDATLKRASCVVGPVARPSAAPGRLGRLLRSMGKLGKRWTNGGNPKWTREVNFQKFPIRRRRLPNLVRRGEASGRGRPTHEARFNAAASRPEPRNARRRTSFPNSARYRPTPYETSRTSRTSREIISPARSFVVFVSPLSPLC